MYDKRELHLILGALTDETHILSHWLAHFEDFNLDEVKYYKETLKLYNNLIRKTEDLIYESEE